MYSNKYHNINRGRATRARGFIALWAVLAMGLGLMASPAAAAPFAYVGNVLNPGVSVIDTATSTVVATVQVGSSIGPSGAIAFAVTPDGKHAYVAVGMQW